MKLVFLNGSPRMKGNTRLLMKTIEKGIIDHIPDPEITFYDTDTMYLKPCSACESCKKSKGLCIHKDDTNSMMAKVLDADVVIFGTPVYWWGISAQLKLAIDKFYCANGISTPIKPKKIGLLTVGADGLETIQYRLISDQFKCISDYLKWPIAFDLKYSAWEAGEIRENNQALEEALGVWEDLGGFNDGE